MYLADGICAVIIYVLPIILQLQMQTTGKRKFQLLMSEHIQQQVASLNCSSHGK